MSFVDMRHARFDEQRQVMERIIASGHCPFCPENLRLYHEQPIIRESGLWLLTPSQWPYTPTRLHLLAILKKHVTKLAELPPGAGDELIMLFQWAEDEYGIPGGAFCMRFGDTDYSAGSVAHLHAQLIVPAITAPDYKEPIRFKIGAARTTP